MTATIRELTATGDADLVQDLVESDPAYTQRVTELPPGSSDGLTLLTMTPPGADPADKHVLGLEEDGRLLGVLDLVRGYPTPAHAFVGLLQTRPEHRGAGHGRTLHGAAVELASTWPGVTTLRLAIVETNRQQAEGFWRAMGYSPTGEVKPYEDGTLATTVHLWERPLRP